MQLDEDVGKVAAPVPVIICILFDKTSRYNLQNDEVISFFINLIVTTVVA